MKIRILKWCWFFYILSCFVSLAINRQSVYHKTLHRHPVVDMICNIFLSCLHHYIHMNQIDKIQFQEKLWSKQTLIIFIGHKFILQTVMCDPHTIKKIQINSKFQFRVFIHHYNLTPIANQEHWQHLHIFSCLQWNSSTQQMFQCFPKNQLKMQLFIFAVYNNLSPWIESPIIEQICKTGVVSSTPGAELNNQ